MLALGSEELLQLLAGMRRLRMFLDVHTVHICFRYVILVRVGIGDIHGAKCESLANLRRAGMRLNALAPEDSQDVDGEIADVSQSSFWIYTPL